MDSLNIHSNNKDMTLIKKHHFFKKAGNISILLFAFLTFLGNPIYSYSQTQQYLIKDKEGLDFILNININGNVVNGYTREKALLDYITKTEYKAVKLLTAVKYPEIIRFKAKLDNTKFKGDYYALYNYRKVTGEIKGEFPRLYEEIRIKSLLFRIEAENARRIQKIKVILFANSNKSVSLFYTHTHTHTQRTKRTKKNRQ